MADSTESRIQIDAPVDKVMAVIADLESYPEWNAEMKTVEVESRDRAGRPLDVRFVIDASALRDDYVLRYDWVGDTEVRWTLVRASMLEAMDGSYRLRDRGDGTTDVIYRLAVDLKIPMIGLIKRKGEKVIVDRALSGLKRRVES
jgi:uncharacterized membrane protein